MFLPGDLWLDIFAYLDIITLSNVCQTNTFFAAFIKQHKWEIMDLFHSRSECKGHVVIPKNMQTYTNFKYIIDFDEIIFNENKLSDDVIYEFEEFIKFPMLSTSQTLSDDVLRRYFNIIPPGNLIKNQTLPYDVLNALLERNEFDNSEWHTICKTQKLDIALIEKYHQRIDWHALSQNKTVVNREILDRYYDRLVWYELTKLGLCEDILIKYKHKIDSFGVFAWDNVSYHSKLSSEFIFEHINILNSMALVSCQELSLDIIEFIVHSYENKEDLLQKVASYQSLSTQFVEKHKTRLPLKCLIRNKKMKRKVIAEVFGN